MVFSNIKERATASGFHLALCIAVAVFASLLVFLLWYPRPLNSAIGATQFFLLIVTVDVILGPLLTFAVFNSKKKSLKLDLAVIAALQLAALAYGMYTMYQGKPAYIVLNEDRFFLPQVKDIDVSLYSRATVSSQFGSVDRLGNPKLAAVKWPTDVKARNDLLFSNSDARVDHYIPIEQAAGQIRQVSKPFADLNKFNKGRDQDLAAVQARWQAQGVKELGFVPLRAEQEDMAVLVDRQAGKVLEIARFAPWE
jgi:hypothetical protein